MSMLYVIKFVGKDGCPDHYREHKYGTTPDLQEAETTSSERSARGMLRYCEKLLKYEHMTFRDHFVRVEIIPVKLILQEREVK